MYTSIIYMVSENNNVRCYTQSNDIESKNFLLSNLSSHFLYVTLSRMQSYQYGW